jgi:hypothetical protein
MVCWPSLNNFYYPGVVLSYNRGTKLYKVQYDQAAKNGETTYDEDLENEKWVLEEKFQGEDE